MSCSSESVTLLILTAAFMVEPMGDYNQIPLLTYSSVRRTMTAQANDVFPCCCADLATMQRYMRDGATKPGNPMYLRNVVAETDGPGGDITPSHGFSSPRLAWQVLHDGGSAPDDVCPHPKLFGFDRQWTTVTQAMRTAALDYRVGPIALLDYTTLSYTDALDYLKAHPGAGVLLSTHGREGYCIIGAEVENGQWVGWWIDHNNRVGPPLVRSVTEEVGNDIWERMVSAGLPKYGRDNFCLIVDHE